MAKTIVSIVSQQTLPNYLFIKEMYQDGDELIFISSQKMAHYIGYITDTLGYTHPKNIIFKKDDDENQWDSMVEQIKPFLSDQVEYVVNLTGGTKYMAMAVKEILSKYNSSFFYIPLPKNILLSPQDVSSIDIKYRIKTKEYLSVYGLECVSATKTLTQTAQTTNGIFDIFVSNLFSLHELDIIDKLRAYRDLGIIDIAQTEQDLGTQKKPQIIGLQQFLKSLCSKVGFKLGNSNRLSKTEIQYLTGGWFEEYTYIFIKQNINPDDIQLGVLIKGQNTTDSNNRNDLDVVFTKGNKLFVIECKTGIPTGKLSAFKEIVNKATALNQTLLGLYAQSFIFALSSEKQAAQFTSAAKYMKINFYDTSYFVDESKKKQLIDLIIRLAN